MTDRPSLYDLESRGDFIRRHIGPTRDDVQHMLDALGLDSLEDLLERAVPASIVSRAPLALTETVSERAILNHLRAMRERNRVNISMIGMGYHGTLMPEVIKRNVLENPGWYTAYTPYQAEISQGRLEALLNFQQVIIDLTGMEIANASMLDEATAAAEAMAMMKRLSKSKSARLLVDADCHPQTIAVVETRARWFEIEVVKGAPEALLDEGEYFGALLQYPGSSGALRDYEPFIAAAHAKGLLVTVASDPLALVLCKPPGEMDADIVVGSAQRFGVPMGYGGPHAAFFATRERFMRSMPGRIIGVSKDRDGRMALRMALQTREQHIRREKATSNICTAQVLLAVLAGFYAVYHGPKGLALIAGRVHRLPQILAAGLRRLGYEVLHEAYFDTLTLRVPNRARHLAARAREAGINLRVVDASHLGIAFDETINRPAVRALWRVFARDADDELDFKTLDDELDECIPENLRRTTPILTHPVFERYHSETEMMRYMRRLARRDIALDRAMIPLGSCTMKLNAAVEMQALSYREFADLHPFAPLDQAQGYQRLFEELHAMLVDLTGFAAFSLQPNAGSQGEYAGLLVIRKHHEVRGEGARDVCLIPASAHGTNPASAAMAGLRVVVVACDDDGNVDIADLRAKAAQHAARLACLMITYPSTHGVFEPSIIELCDIVHEHGGQVYMDGANFNALVGICRPAEIGADVMHINLHKTFAIPHGGGGPGMGPIGVKAHLAPYLPDHPVVGGVNPYAGPAGTIGAVSAAPWGSASILSISWAYIAMMGAYGLRRATMVAILAANYVAARLAPYYPVLYTGAKGMVAHECIIDLRAIKASTGITVDDVAKRLADYGFHAPTMSFPVADTLMIEPTESESLRELDRFCEAMIRIRAEIQAVADGKSARDDNPLSNAPHHHSLLIEESWTRPYSKAEAFFPMAEQHEDKYWPPVARIDNVFGDKHVVCSCPPMEAWQD
ncbi:MAG: aminomethyl-transferring glycine dehydrogenase [Gammaproteobacteria bacterium]|nr:aminomethyl-transferring glycine dehydrogenase [Gammaproteobacteria bacterium]